MSYHGTTNVSAQNSFFAVVIWIVLLRFNSFHKLIQLPNLLIYFPSPLIAKFVA